MMKEGKRRPRSANSHSPALSYAILVLIAGAAVPAALGGPIKTVVVVVMENRSFDHMLGWMKQLNPKIDGVDGSEWNPTSTTDPKAGQVYFKDGAQYVDPDPGHSFHRELGFTLAEGELDPARATSRARRMEEDSFEVRVKRLFGSQLFESVPRNSFPSSSWSVVDGEVERREWNRERGFGPDRSEDPCSSDFAEGGCFAKKRSSRRNEAEDFELDVDELGDDPEAEGPREEEGYGGDDTGEESEIRASIGLDPTLDNEDEEDEYDRAALGQDASSERLYMGDIKKHGPHLNYYSIFTEAEDEPYDVSSHFNKDPGADHLAAGMRIEEDQKSAEGFPVPNHSKAETAADDSKLKPILKRKELHDDSKPKKRVRFDNLISSAVEANSAMFDESPGLPDYLRNPSKYTHYTFDEYEDSDSANKGAFEDLHSLLYKKSNLEQMQQHMDDGPPKSIKFNPRRKPTDAPPDVQESDSGVTRSTGIAAGESLEAVAYKIDEDYLEETPMDTETPADAERSSSSSRRGRQYRSMSASEV